MIFEEKDGRVFVNGIEYVPKEKPITLANSYNEIVEKYDYTGEPGYYISEHGVIEKTSINVNTEAAFFNEEYAQAMLILKRLLEIRNEYNGDWKPNWVNATKQYCIEFSGKDIRVEICIYCPSNEFIFKTKELAEQFLKNHREDIEFVFKHLYMWNN